MTRIYDLPRKKLRNESNGRTQIDSITKLLLRDFLAIRIVQ